MAYVESFESFPLGRSGAILSAFPLSDPAVQRTILAQGKVAGGKALSLYGGAGADNLVRGVESANGGRASVVRLGFTLYLAQPNSGTQHDSLTIGQTLFELRAAAARAEIHGHTYERDEFSRILCFNTSSRLYDQLAVGPDGTQAAGTLQTHKYRHSVARVGVGIDGNIKVIRGDNDATASGQQAVIAAVSSQRIPLERWVQVEFEFKMGSFEGSDGYVRAYLDGEQVINVDTNFCPPPRGSPSDDTQFYPYYLPTVNTDTGCLIFNIDETGFFDFVLHEECNSGSRIDDLYILGDAPVTPGVPLGDLRVVEMAINGDHTPQGSTIGGSTPAATRWQSVAADDAGVTEVVFAGNAEDRYTHAALGAGPEVVAMRVLARVAKSDSGFATVALTADDGTTVVDSEAESIPVADEYEEHVFVITETPSAGVLDVAAVNSIKVGVKRVT
jgi:hypothetical protein